MQTVVPSSELKGYIGKDLGHSDWFLIDQDRINQFADVTVDHQFIHVDEEKARHTPFGGTIAHGFLTLSLLTHLNGAMRLGARRHHHGRQLRLRPGSLSAARKGQSARCASA